MQGHACMHKSRNQRKGGGVQYWGPSENFEIFMLQESFWCNPRVDARLETIKWPFLD